MVKSKDGDFFVSDWLRNRNTIEFLSIWEEVNNPHFNYGESAIIKSQAWLNNYKISIKERTEKTHAIGIVSTAGRYGWTYAHKDIAFEFSIVYANEADVLNVALFGKTAKEWRNINSNKIGNMRDEATIEQLIVLANIESMNAEYIKHWLPQSKRLELLNRTAISQMKSLIHMNLENLS